MKFLATPLPMYSTECSLVIATVHVVFGVARSLRCALWLGLLCNVPMPTSK